MINVYIVDGSRTKFTEFGESFAEVDATTLGTATASRNAKYAVACLWIGGGD